MLLAAFTKNWWKSKKSEDGSEQTEPEHGNEALEKDPSLEERGAIDPAKVETVSLHAEEENFDEEHPHESEEEEGYIHEGGGSAVVDDPIEEAYDFEHSEQQRFDQEDSEREGRNKPSRSTIKSAKEFFNTEILYRFDIIQDTLRKQLAGTYRLELKGYQGGIWTVKVGDQLDVVNKREDSEITYNMQQRDFVLLVNGELNPQLAIFAGKMKITGDLKKSVSFIELLAPLE